MNEKKIRSEIEAALLTSTSSEDVKKKVVASCGVLPSDVIVEFVNRNAAHVVVEATGDRRKIQVVRLPDRRRINRRKKPRVES